MAGKKVQKLDSLKPGIIKNIKCLQGSIPVTLTSCTYSWSPDLPFWIQLLHYIQITMDFLLWSNPIQLNWRQVILSPYGQHYLVLFRNGQFPISFLYFRLCNTVDSKQMSNINFADYGIRTADIWYRKHPLFQLSHNHRPFSGLFLLGIVHQPTNLQL